jgi:hypothetical protein
MHPFVAGISPIPGIFTKDSFDKKRITAAIRRINIDSSKQTMYLFPQLFSLVRRYWFARHCFRRQRPHSSENLLDIFVHFSLIVTDN